MHIFPVSDNSESTCKVFADLKVETDPHTNFGSKLMPCFNAMYMTLAKLKNDVLLP